MKTSESWKTWLPLLGALVIFALLTAIWPALANALSLPSLSFGGGSSTTVPVEPEPIHLEALKDSLAASPLASVAESLPDTISPFTGLLVVAGAIIGGTVVVGGGISLIFKLLAGLRESTIEAESFKEHQNALEQRTKEQLKQMREGRTTDPQPSHKMPRWSVISNTLIALMFVGFATIVVVRNFFPEGTAVLNNALTGNEPQIINITTPVYLVMALITLLIIGLRLRPQKIDAIDETDTSRIPWDFIAILVTGVIMLGLGIGLMAYLSSPA